MSNNNFVHVGKVTVPVGKGSIGKPRVPVVEDVEIVVGVRADLGEVVVAIDGQRNGALPSLTGPQASALAELLDLAAGSAASLSEAYQTYQATLQRAEADLEQAFAQGASA
ncbi:hypothetical protein SEA_ROSMARINUS_59 [Mycobacterium Phage Rosmarinus]|uniref:Uncharacterized protein n=2 Tax=Anayavirus TaxID=2946797 RepID=G1BPR3_9CAUD|nr:hypothetical protein I5G89_gp41 [Mycobacterium phage Adephagia]YP_009952488.1 hypothetical protein I5G91_gp35 [Mycobacterium phage AlishaPH]APU93163.1 hypothetical protein SEA_CREW_59 [Mycobacterium phage CREW]ASR86892.1 hypothetical protein SEA_JECKYLL_59 [Mycobacterium phage Jeckyll]ASR87666.1 hypothetical protein SEA_TACHEZ_59 [Mycobacterium phage Tachez]AXH47089.1 hypothetical protein SEA_BEEST_59 [Mycobacterium phage BEEST]AXH50028.1 hypothetical protein SEA_HOMURA_59 [Mycobacterium p